MSYVHLPSEGHFFVYSQVHFVTFRQLGRSFGVQFASVLVSYQPEAEKDGEFPAAVLPSA